MPDRPPSDFDSQSDWTSYCVPFMMDEGMENDQAVAACLQMWRDKSLSLPSVGRAWSVLTVKSLDSEERIIEGIATTPSVDRIGDSIVTEGMRLRLPLPLLRHHRKDEPVGQVLAAKVTKDGISIKAQLAKVMEPGPLKERIDTTWQEIRAGLIRGLSVGFRPTEWEPIETGIKFLKSELLELSLVVVPANADCNITMIKSLDQAASGHTTPTSRPGATGTKRTATTPVSLKERKAMSKTIAEQIEGLQAARAQKSARMNAIMEKTIEDGRSTDEAEQEEFSNLEREVEQIDGDLERFTKLDKLNVQRAVPVEAKTVEDGAASRGGPTYVKVSAPRLPPGLRFARVAKCKALARLDGQDVVRVAERLYGDDQPVVNICKAAVPAGNTFDPVWAGNLVSDEGAVFADFLAWLRPMTILGKFGQGNVPALRQIPFRVPIGSQTSGGAGYWVGEGQAKPLTSFTFARTVLEPLKVANIAVVTEELLRYAAIPAETLLRDQLAAALTERLDTDFIDPDKTAVTSISPASITNGVTPVASSGVTADAVRADVASLLDAFIAVDNPASSAVWIMSASTALRLSMMYNTLGQAEFNGISVNGGTFAGFPVIVSEYVGTSGGSPNTRYVWLVNARDVFFADEGGVSVDMSRETSLVMDTAPTMSSAGIGSPQTPVTGNMVSMFQTNSVAFRAERQINWAKARTEAVQGLSGVVWGT